MHRDSSYHLFSVPPSNVSFFKYLKKSAPHCTPGRGFLISRHLSRQASFFPKRQLNNMILLVALLYLFSVAQRYFILKVNSFLFNQQPIWSWKDLLQLSPEFTTFYFHPCLIPASIVIITICNTCRICYIFVQQT